MRADGGKIKRARQRAGLTQEELARAVGVTVRNVVRWETGRNQPRADHLFRIADVCSVNVSDLLEDQGKGPLTREQRLVHVGLAIEALLVPELS